MKALRVGVDATSWTNRRGYGRFARNVIGRMIERDPDTTYVLFTDGEIDLPEGAEEHRVQLRRKSADAVSASSSRSVSDLLRLTRAASGDDLDAFVFPSVYTYFPVLRTPTVVGIHDAISVQLPQLTHPDRKARALWRVKQWLALRGATTLFTVSNAARQAIAEALTLEPSRLAVVPEAPDPRFCPRSSEQTRVELERLGLANERFYLYAGGISPHKNLETLVAAFARLVESRPAAPLLVIVGDLEGETHASSSRAIIDQAAAAGIADRVLFPGFVSDDALACLYGAAAAVVNPSLGEGFGLPAVEAAACGAPLVLSDLPAHRENLGDAALYFPPLDADSLLRNLVQLLDDPDLAATLGRRARAVVAPLSWDAAADRLTELVVAAARPNGAGGG